jgi:radical SAM superfamily enzyme YgiQ (UPF0313 family)
MKKNILFVLPKKDKGDYVFPQTPPLGILTLAALTDKKRFNVRLVDENIGKIDFGEMPDLVCISLSTGMVDRGYQLCDHYKKKGVPIILGGFHASAMPEQALQHCTSVVIGECEDIWPGVLNDFLESKLKKKYKQLTPTNLAILPQVDFSLCKGSYLLKNVVQTTRGCPYDCSFCCVSTIYGKQIRHRPLDNVIRDIINMKNNSKGLLKNWFFVTDDNIMADMEYSKELFRRLIPLKIRLIVQSSVSIGKDNEVLRLAYRAGVRILFIGLESLDQKFLDKVRKPNNASDYQRIMLNIKRHKIAVMASFMFEAGKTPKDIFEKTLAFCQDYAELAVFFPFYDIPGSKLPELGSLAVPRHQKFEKTVAAYNTKFYSLGKIIKRAILVKQRLEPSPSSLATYFLMNCFIRMRLGGL